MTSAGLMDVTPPQLLCCLLLPALCPITGSGSSAATQPRQSGLGSGLATRLLRGKQVEIKIFSQQSTSCVVSSSSFVLRQHTQHQQLLGVTQLQWLLQLPVCVSTAFCSLLATHSDHLTLQHTGDHVMGCPDLTLQRAAIRPYANQPVTYDLCVAAPISH